MMAVKHIGPKEFQEIGFLQEANRLFFHPHGLALEMTSVDEGGDTPLRERVLKAMTAAATNRVREGDVEMTLKVLADAVVNELAPPGSLRFSGCWDYRDDPEGIVFGSGGFGDSQGRADRVRAERLKHAEHRAEMFYGAGPQLKELGAVGAERHSLDIEPLNYVYEEGS